MKILKISQSFEKFWKIQKKSSETISESRNMILKVIFRFWQDFEGYQISGSGPLLRPQNLAAAARPMPARKVVYLRDYTLFSI